MTYFFFQGPLSTLELPNEGDESSWKKSRLDNHELYGCSTHSTHIHRFASIQASTTRTHRCPSQPRLSMTTTESTEPAAAVTPTLASSTVTSGAAELQGTSAERGLERIPWQENGYLTWDYDGHKVNYVDEGDKSKVRGRTIYHCVEARERPKRKQSVRFFLHGFVGIDRFLEFKWAIVFLYTYRRHVYTVTMVEFIAEQLTCDNRTDRSIIRHEVYVLPQDMEPQLRFSL